MDIKRIGIYLIRHCSLCVLYFLVGCRYNVFQGGQKTMNQIKIGEFLKELRKEKRFTQEQLAEEWCAHEDNYISQIRGE